MKTTFAAQPPLSRQDRSPLATKIVLALVFLLGAAIIALGIAGQRAFETSGFSAEAAYSAIHALSRDTKAAWEKKLQPQLNALPEAQREKTDEAALSLLRSAFEGLSSGGAQRADEILTSAAESDRAALAYKLLYAAYLTGGPKVSTAQKKEIAALQGEELAALQKALLEGVTDESVSLPSVAAKAAELEGQDRQAMLLQLLFTADGSAASTDQVSAGHAAAIALYRRRFRRVHRPGEHAEKERAGKGQADRRVPHDCQG